MLTDKQINDLLNVSARASAFADKVHTISHRVVDFLDTFAGNLEDEATKHREQASAREEAMQAHPAGKGRAENKSANLTREQKIKYVADYITEQTGDTKSIWHVGHESISDFAVEVGWLSVVQAKEAKKQQGE